ncbi:MAG: hypothetical protein R2695_02265 [Acidimicrobiales bacterium]
MSACTVARSGPARALCLRLLRLRRAVGLGDPGLFHDLGGEPATDRLEVEVVVGHVLDLHHVEVEPEGLDVVVGLVDELLGELQPVLVDLLWRQGREDPRRFASSVSLAI